MKMAFISRLRIAMIVSACVLASAQAHGSDTTQSGQTSAILISVDGPVYLAPSETAPATLLGPKTKLLRPLHAGEILRCGKGGSAVIRIGGVKKIIYCSDKPYRIPPVALTEVEKQELEALELYGRIGGTRGGDVVWSPAENSYVRPQSTTIAWKAFPGQLSFQLVDGSGAVLWSASKVDALKGCLADKDKAAFRAALLAAQSEDQQVEVTLKASTSDHDRYSFRILSRKVASKLDAALAKIALDEPEPVLRHLAEANVLCTHEYYVDAGAEFDSAADEAPESTLVLADDLAIQEKIGNLDGATKLRDKLKTLCKASIERDTSECDGFREAPRQPETETMKISRSCDPGYKPRAANQ